MKEHKDTIYKTVYQYNQVLIPDADMEKLLELVRDCREVRNSVYERYGGIRGLSKIYPDYTAQNEMTKSGLPQGRGGAALHSSDIRGTQKNNSEMKKYNAEKVRPEKAMHSYVNAETNQMLETEKPEIV